MKHTILTPQSIAKILISKHDLSVAIDCQNPSLKNKNIFGVAETKRKLDNGRYFIYQMTKEVANSGYRDYLKLIMSICLAHLNHLLDSKFLNLQVKDQIDKYDSDSIEGFDRIFSKQYKGDNYSFCFCMILSMVLRKTISLHWIGSLENIKAITQEEFEAAAYQVVGFPPRSGNADNHIIAWAIKTESKVYINFYASKLLTLLIKIGDEMSILLLMSNSRFAVRDAVSLAQAIELAINSENQSLLAMLAKILQSIEPKHPAIVLANSYLRKYELYAKSSISVDEISKMSGVDFEFALRNALIKHSNFESVEVTPASGDYGADLILTTKQGTRIAAQCKRFSSKVNLKAVQEVVAAINHYGCDLGVVISNNGFLNSAQELAKSNEIELWDGEAVLKIFAGEFDFSEVFSV